MHEEIARGRARLASLIAGDADGHDLLMRYDRWAPDLWAGLAEVYVAADVLPAIVDVIAAVHQQRPSPLRERDRERLLRPDWFQDEHAVGYVAYTDLFAGDLAGVAQHIDYLTDLGITYLHLMPLLTPRPGANDGGYAVMDYRSVRSDLGTMADLAALATSLHSAGISLTLDLVLNHVAREHVWAQKAQGGDPKYRDYFRIFDDRTVPDEFEATLPEVFPAFAPGNFTWDEDLSGWVWTTFNEWQWDLNWANPDVLVEFVDIIGFLANQGADCIRLDAIAFIWKRMGTNCQNQPEVHALTQALRAATRIMSPAVVFKAEAIVGPQDVVAYLGQGSHAGRVSDLAYHNSLMVQIWSALAARDGRLLVAALSRFDAIPVTTSWATYLRCHDDIGWAIDDADAGAVGWDGFSHRSFLAEFYSGEFEGSFAAGAHFQSNPLTGDRRTSGTAASLAGVETALRSGDAATLSTAIERLICAYAMVFGFGGIPLIYMGDEWGLLNDEGYLADPAKADDNRWMHRPAMDWDTASHPVKGSMSARINAAMRDLIRARQHLPALHANVSTECRVTDDPTVLVFRRRHPAGTLIEVYNLSESTRVLWPGDLAPLASGSLHEHISDTTMVIDGPTQLPPYAAWWLTSA